MNKKITAFLVCTVLCAAAFAQSEDDFSVTLNDAGDGAVITKYSGKGGSLTIPATIQGFPVKQIGDRAFYDKRLTSVVIPEGVRQIGREAFGNNRGLTSVTIPSTVRRRVYLDDKRSVGDIWPDAFSGCPNLDVPTQLALRKLGYTD